MANPIRHRSRAVLLWGLGVFLGTQLLGSLLLDYCWPVLRFPSAARVLSLVSQTPPPRLVLLGSSRIEIGIESAEMEDLLRREFRLEQGFPILNAAVPAGDPITMEHMLGQLLQRSIRPEWVVVEISPETLNEYNEWLGIHVRRQLRWDHMPSYLAQMCWSGQGQRMLSARLFALFLHREQILARVASGEWIAALGERRSVSSPVLPTATGELTQRRSPQPLDWPELLQPPPQEVTPELRDKIELTTRFQLGRWLRHYRIAGHSPRSLERMLQFCRQQQIQALLVTMPVTAQHRSTYTPQIEQAFQDYLARLRRDFPCRYIDCRDWVADGLFLDNHHLGHEGCIHFTRLLTYHVLAPLWRDQPFTRPPGSQTVQGW